MLNLVVRIVTTGHLRVNGFRKIVAVCCKNHSKQILCTNAAFVSEQVVHITTTYVYMLTNARRQFV